jgi:hypothetical protein
MTPPNHLRRRLLSILALAALLFLTACPLPAPAQIPSGYVQTTATVSALANGSYGASWTNLSSSPQLGLLGCVSTFQTTVNGNFDSYGHFSTLLADIAQICPSPSTWTFTLTCATGSLGSYQLQIPVTGGGATEDVSVQITTALPAQPCTTAPVAGVTKIVPGSNITCSPLSTGSCTGAVTINSSGGGGGGGGTPGGSNTDVQVNVLGAFGGYSGLTYSPSAGLGIGGPITTNTVTVGPQNAIPLSWIFDWTSPSSACLSIDCIENIGVNGTNLTPANGSVNFVQGANMTLTRSGNQVTLASTAGSTTNNSLTFATSGGASPGATFNGGAPVTVSPVTIGAAANNAATTVNGQTCTLGSFCTISTAPTSQNDVTASRVFSTVYTNGPSAITVEVAMSTLGSSACTGANIYMSVSVGATTGTMVTIPGNGIWNECQGVAETTFVVPPNYVYEVTWAYLSGPPSSVVIAKWVELSW